MARIRSSGKNVTELALAGLFGGARAAIIQRLTLKSRRADIGRQGSATKSL